MGFPLIVTFSIGCASGDAAPTSIPSSHGTLIPSPAQCWRNSSTLFSVGMRVSLKGSGILTLIKERQVRLSTNFLKQHETQLAQMIVTPHRTFTVRDFLSLRDVIPPIRSMINRMQQ